MLHGIVLWRLSKIFHLKRANFDKFTSFAAHKSLLTLLLRRVYAWLTFKYHLFIIIWIIFFKYLQKNFFPLLFHWRKCHTLGNIFFKFFFQIYFCQITAVSVQFANKLRVKARSKIFHRKMSQQCNKLFGCCPECPLLSVLLVALKIPYSFMGLFFNSEVAEEIFLEFVSPFPPYLLASCFCISPHYMRWSLKYR